MVNQRLNREQAFQRLQEAVAKAGSARAWARAHGISPSFLCMVLQSKRKPSPQVYSALGLRIIIEYEPMEPL